MNPYLLQKQIKDNASDLESFCKDLKQWKIDMEKNENKNPSSDNEQAQDATKPKIRKLSGSSPLVKKQKKKKDNSRPKSSLPIDYSAWDKFDVEAECAKVDEDSSDESYLTDECDNGALELANTEKEKGNNNVKKKLWDKAIEDYSAAIKLYAYDPIFYANRALCYLKLSKFQQCEEDCNKALKLDSDYVKALHRRALARQGLGHLSEAHEDLQKILKLEPNNKETKAELLKLENQLEEVNKIKPSNDESQRPKSKFTMSRQRKENKVNPYVDTSIKTNNSENINVELDAIQNHVIERRPPNQDQNLNFNESYSANRNLNNINLNVNTTNANNTNNPSNNRDASTNVNSANVSSNSRNTANESYSLNSPLNNTQINEPKPSTSQTSTSLGQGNLTSIWPSGEDVELIETIYKPPNQRSKRKLKRIEVTDVDVTKMRKQSPKIEVVKESKGNVGMNSKTKDNGSNSTKTSNKNVYLSSNNNNYSITASSNSPSSKIEEIGENEQIDYNFPVPRTAIQFYNNWKIIMNKSVELRLQYLSKIPPDNFTDIFKESLSCNVFSEIIATLAQDEKHIVSTYNCLLGLTKVKRFGALVMFMSRDDKKCLLTLIDFMRDDESLDQDDVNELIKKYEL